MLFALKTNKLQNIKIKRKYLNNRSEILRVKLIDFRKHLSCQSKFYLFYQKIMLFFACLLEEVKSTFYVNFKDTLPTVTARTGWCLKKKKTLKY